LIVLFFSIIVELSKGDLKVRPLRIAVRWIIIICLPILFLSTSIAWAFNSHWIFTLGFQKYNVSQTTGITNSELEKIPQSWTDYINSGDEYWHIIVTRDGSSFELFTPEEQSHFKDVKLLIWLDYCILAATLILILGYALSSIFWRRPRYWRQLASTVLWGSGISIALIIVLGIASMLDFNQLFLQLHYLLFTNSNWSAEGYMLMLFPGGFWFDAALICIGMMAGLAIIAGAIALAFLKINPKKPGST
jgi:integral membrane protein (TIGR01906 family)